MSLSDSDHRGVRAPSTRKAATCKNWALGAQTTSIQRSKSRAKNYNLKDNNHFACAPPPAVPTGDLARTGRTRRTPLRCLRQAHSAYPNPSHTHMPPSSLPTFPHRLYTPPHTSTRRRPTAPIPPATAPPDLRQRASPPRPPPFPPRPHPKPPPPDAQPHRAASPHAVPRDTRRSISSDSPCPPSPPPPPKGASPF